MAGVVRAQVVVVGGGPVGLLLACELAGFGVRTVVVEAREEVSGRPKATTLHARTVQCLARRGHLPALAGVGTGTGAGAGAGAGTGTSAGEGAGVGAGMGKGAGSAFHFAGIAGLVIGAPQGEPEAVWKVAQEDVERVFEERARAAGVEVWRGWRVVGVRQGSGGVRVTARGPGGEVGVDAGYAVGADGARSVVRELAGFASRTYPATVSAMAGDVRLAEAQALRPGWHRTGRGWILAKDAGGGVMRLRTLNCSGAHPDRHAPLDVEELRREVSFIAGRDIAMGAGRWLSRFSDFSRLVSSYRRGRILLAGDAAHVHFPIGGQGLSAGLLDALGLGWKLAFTVRGTAGEALLDSYGAERRPAAQRVIDQTRAQLALMRPDPGLDPLRALFGELMARGGAEGSVLASMVSAQDTVLPARGAGSSPWEGRFVPNAVLDTAQGRTDVTGLLGEGRPLLLCFGEEAAARYGRRARPWARLARVVRADPVPALDCEALLVRPDGYAGWAAGGGALEAALRAYCGPGDTGPGDTASRDTVPRDTVPGDTTAGDTAFESTAAGGTASSYAAPGGTLSGGTASGGTASGDTTAGDTAFESTAAGGTASSYAAPGGTLSGGTASGDTPPADTASGDTAFGDTAFGERVSGGTASGDTPPSGTASSDTAPGGTLSGDTAAGGTPSGGTASGDTPPADTASGDTASGDTPPTDTASGGTAAGGQAGGAVVRGRAGGAAAGAVS
ncbi:FAD-dependent monooxygenase [Streptomyces sp. NPDC005329]|uniref:FAD-dependent monooxygenase n=1 Tax=Streptomyces sp. NPDC005329 TaxID=3157034 RepID=UPI0033AD9CD6